MATAPQTAWIWQDDMTQSVMGATADLDERLIRWWDQPGCACGDSRFTQAIADFISNGPAWFSPPDDVLGEMRSALSPYA